MAAAPGVFGLEKLTCRHGVKLSPPAGVSVEECVLAVGEILGHGGVKSASRMNSMVVVFVDSTDKADELLVAGVVVNGELTPVFSLSPVKKVIVSNVPPFLKNDLLLRELSRHGRVVSPMSYSSCSKSPLLRHVVSFRRQVSMVLNDNKEELKLTLRFRVDEFDYTVYVTTDSLKCFAQRRAHDEDSESTQNARSDTGKAVEVEEPAGLQGGHLGDHVDLRSGRLIRELVEQTVSRVAETVLDMEDVGVEENSINVSIKQKNTDTKALYRLKTLLLKVLSRLESAD
ncbi:Transposon TX1 uncharacterized 82 kDa protein ORF 1 [Takifugu flavidus]|uniref:Transposon TX1 uncharacterized 82 kDa protein ORF 1 n=1 Tax=Takifugu flavidus TaxID=433684 RepID=A0A5C6N557_9TELE|nr:Transposon TX1 uncharacterized 82 kDa protein ORF 1 [Takifugu flavidus]